MGIQCFKFPIKYWFCCIPCFFDFYDFLQMISHISDIILNYEMFYAVYILKNKFIFFRNNHSLLRYVFIWNLELYFFPPFLALGVCCHFCWNVPFSSVRFSHSVMSESLWPHGLQHARTPYSTPTPGNLLKPMSIESVMPSNHLILCRPLLLLPSVFPSIRVFSNESALCIR